MSGSRRWQRKVHRQAPLRGCSCGCGRRVRSWKPYPEPVYARGHAPAPAPAGESIRDYLRRRDGKCVVCGGPFPDGSGCEFCPAVTDEERGDAA